MDDSILYTLPDLTTEFLGATNREIESKEYERMFVHLKPEDYERYADKRITHERQAYIPGPLDSTVRDKERYKRIKWSLTLPIHLIHGVVSNLDYKCLELLLTRHDVDVNQLKDGCTPLDTLLDIDSQDMHHMKPNFYTILMMLHTKGAYYVKEHERIPEPVGASRSFMNPEEYDIVMKQLIKKVE